MQIYLQMDVLFVMSGSGACPIIETKLRSSEAEMRRA
jgi:hypothetical protein